MVTEVQLVVSSMIKNIIFSFLIACLALVSIHLGYFIGHEDGFEIGKRVGAIEAMLHKGGSCFLHNGRAE